MEEIKYKVLITTSGIGQRLGELTKYTNKSLVRVGKKPVLSYIIEAYPEDVPLVITVGCFSNHVKDFVNLAYPERNVEFVNVDNYEGEGSSLGYSMLQARSILQCPFIYHASDTIISEKISTPTKNWIGGYKGGDTSQYASWKIIDNDVLVFGDKGALNFDYIHIGLVGVNDYKNYWDILEKIYKENPKDQSLNDCRVVIDMIKNQKNFEIVDFPTWLDMGNTISLKDARKNISDHFSNLDKVEESVFLFDDFVLKFFSDKELVRERVLRAEILKGLTPKVDKSTENFYRYKYVEGELYSEVVTPVDFVNFLKWAKDNLWTEANEVKDSEFKKICFDFYYTKTVGRVDKFFKLNSLSDEEHIVNGESIPKIKDMLSQIDFDWLSDSKQTNFHGDFILDNIIKTADGYSLIDWRNNFGGLLHSGDIYYDLAKLNHNLTVNHGIINDNLFTIKSSKSNTVECDILRKDNLVECQKVLHRFIEKEGYDLSKVKVLTSLIWLNMAPLHHHPFNIFLYYFGKLNLWRAIKENK